MKMPIRLVVPGDQLEDKPANIEHAIIEHDRTYSTVLGNYDDEKKKLIPLEGLWYPIHGDVVIGIIEEEKLNSYSVSLNAPYKGIIVAKYMETQVQTGDVVEAFVKELDKTGTVVLMRAKKLFGGKIMNIKPSKVPRVIGKQDTMLKQLSDGTKAMIKVGRNGMVWMKGGDIALATAAIMRIQEEAHTQGLTERIKEMLETRKV